MNKKPDGKDNNGENRGISRRDFLKGASLIGGSLLAWRMFGSANVVHAQETTSTPDHYAMLTDMTRCVGCRRCEEACNKANNLPPPKVPFDEKSVFAEVRRTEPGVYTVVNRYNNPKTGDPVFRKVQCNHCVEPACASACPVGALKKSKEGPVTYNENICIGCRYCMTACPFYIPTFQYNNAGSPAIQKCFMCYQRIAQGLVPACATECPAEAIAFGTKKELIKTARARIAGQPDRYIDQIYGENEAGGTDWLYLSGVPFAALGFPTNVGTTPYPELTREFLAGVPLVLTAFPALLGGIYLLSNKRDKTEQPIGPQNGDEK